MVQVLQHVSPSQQQAQYEDEGYLVFPELLDQAELATLRAALAEVLREADGLTESNDKFSVVRSDDGARHVVRAHDRELVVRLSQSVRFAQHLSQSGP